MKLKFEYFRLASQLVFLFFFSLSNCSSLSWFLILACRRIHLQIRGKKRWKYYHRVWCIRMWCNLFEISFVMIALMRASSKCSITERSWKRDICWLDLLLIVIGFLKDVGRGIKRFKMHFYLRIKKISKNDFHSEKSHPLE